MRPIGEPYSTRRIVARPAACFIALLALIAISALPSRADAIYGAFASATADIYCTGSSGLSVTGGNGQVFATTIANGGDICGNSSSAASLANLANGDLSVQATATTTFTSFGAAWQQAGGGASAAFNDVLTITAPSSDLGQTVSLSATLVGAVFGPLYPGFGGPAPACQSSPDICYGNSDSSASAGVTFGVAFNPGDFGTSTVCSTLPEENHFVCTDTSGIVLTSTTQTVAVYGALNAGLWAFGPNTNLTLVAYDPIQLSLPPGASFSSASGVFLTQPPSQVPEPSTLLLVCPGLLATWRWLRRKH